jgi:hypothetical protein
MANIEYHLGMSMSEPFPSWLQVKSGLNGREWWLTAELN